MIALIDYGAGNLRSVHKALRFTGADVNVVTRAEEINGARGIVLPGVGAFDDCVNALQRQDLIEATRRRVQEGMPFLGICVGYQALFERSEEFNSCAAGFGIFGGSVVRFSGSGGLKVPQIGWNQLHLREPACPLFAGIEEGSYVYFVHSFYPKPADNGIIAAETTYGETFASAVWRDNIFATQFHPEKSQQVGLRLLANFTSYCDRA
jgi:glutamine amidotransferase